MYLLRNIFAKKIIVIMFSHKNSQSNLILEHDVVIFRFGFSLSSQFLFLASFYKSWFQSLMIILMFWHIFYIFFHLKKFYIYILSFFGFKFEIIFQIYLSQRDKFQTYSEILILSVITVLAVILYGLLLMLNERRIYYSWNYKGF